MRGNDERHINNKQNYFRLALREVQAQISFVQAQLPTVEDKHHKMLAKIELSALQERESYLKSKIKQINKLESEARSRSYSELFREVAKRKLPPNLYQELEQMTRGITETAAAAESASI